ncbi:MAG: hypothetical protein J2P25_24330, partial [Nocardiopsaceae bacterium]|nr:hypothetical protein [Nocardiopsaceae bacterium]
TGLASAVPAVRAVGVLPDGSLVPGQVAALAERLGAPGRMIAEPGELPERWASLLNDGLYVTGGGPTAAAHLAAVLPEADGLAIHLAGLVTLPGMGTRIFGGLRVEMPARGGQSPSPGQALWLRDDRGSWHSVSLGGWSSCEDGYSFQAAVVPPVGPETSHIELYITGPTTEVRVASPLTWWVP